VQQTRIWSIAIFEQNIPPAPILLRIYCKSSNFTGPDEEVTSLITSAPRSGTIKFPVLSDEQKSITLE